MFANTAINPRSRWALLDREQRAPTTGTGRLQDLTKLVAWALLLVLAMAVVVIGVNVLFGRK
jgi:hypothetical protein